MPSKVSTSYRLSVLRNRYFFLADLVLVTLAVAASFYLRLDSERVVYYQDTLAVVAASAILAKPIVFYFYGLYRRYWRYASADDMWTIVMAVTTASIPVAILAIVVAPLWLTFPSVPRSIPIIDWLLTLALVGGIRFSARILARRPARGDYGRPMQPKRVLVMGAGDAGAMIVQEMRANPQLSMTPVGFVDDNAAKAGMTIRDVAVLGTRRDIPALVAREAVDEVIIAMPTASGKDIRDTIEICRSIGVSYKTIPGVFELISGNVSLKQIREVQVEDLLRRDPVEIDQTALDEYLNGIRILVTGAGGSIGSEICRQVASCDPRQLILLGHGEHSIYQIERELRHTFPSLDVAACIADVRDLARLNHVFEQYRPSVVFHAAAHKHVPLMESNVAESITNNVLGTQCVIRAATASNVNRFVLISTDKAVNPVSAMGASKRVAEMLVQDAARHAKGVFVAVRFGNVLGSRGSVVPLFREQIMAGGPITITDPEMTRYFMTIPEATNLVVQAGALGRSGEIYMLDMGQPVRIVDLARDMIELSGLRVGDDIEIEFIGARRGEKIREELFSQDEDTLPTSHTSIRRLRGELGLDSRQLQRLTSELIEVARSGDEAESRERLIRLAVIYGKATPDDADASGAPRDALADEVMPGQWRTAARPAPTDVA